MERIGLKLVISLILIAVVSCDEPDTVVTDVVHPDGSVTRQIEMRSSKNNFGKSVLQVPYDSTWSVSKSFQIGAKKDTTWIVKAVKLFSNVEEINRIYRNDSGPNNKFSRKVKFYKKFRWFNTEFRFSEVVDKHLKSGYPIEKFLDKEELSFFYAPDNLKYLKESGADSIKYKKLSDTIEAKSEEWLIKNVSILWIEEFARLTGPAAGANLSEQALINREDEFIGIIKANMQKFDSLWAKGVILKKFIGEEAAIKYKTEADSALSVASNIVLIDFKNYSVRIIMPGKLTGTNGYIDSTKNLIWPVKSDYFLTDQYEMWAESKTPNIWAWVVSGFFLAFVAAGIIIKRKNPAGGGIQTIT